jgi:hypothetical protein
MDQVLKWTVCVRADGRSDVDAQHAARILPVADLGGDVVRWAREPRSIIVEAIVEAVDEDGAYDRVIGAIRGLLNPTWIVQRCSPGP